MAGNGLLVTELNMIGLTTEIVLLVLVKVIDVRLFGIVTEKVLLHCCTTPVWVEIVNVIEIGAVEGGFFTVVS